MSSANLSVNIQPWSQYKDHVTNVQQRIGTEVLNLVYDVANEDGSLRQVPFWFMFAPRAGHRRHRPMNAELMICQPIGVELNGGVYTGREKLANEKLDFVAKRHWMMYPGIYPTDLPKDVETDEARQGHRQITLNDLQLGIDKGYIWICENDIWCDDEGTDFWMPYCPSETTVDVELEADVED